MVMSRIRLRRSLSALSRLSSTALANPYYHHQLIWGLFSRSPDQSRNFLFRIDDCDRWVQYYTVSERRPDPDDELWEINVKPYEPKITKGMHLRFSLTANPVVATIDANKRRHRHDVVMHALKREEADQGRGGLRPALINNEGQKWLKRKGRASGFSFQADDVVVSGYRQQRFRKEGGGRLVQLSTLDFSGILTVEDPELFTTMLFHGLGPAKAFGCGLMLVKRP